MSKRLHDTEIWRGLWFRKLTPETKLLWLYLLDTCSCAGIVEVDDFEQISFLIGCKITEINLNQLDKQFMRIDERRILLLDFIDFQYGALHETHKMKNKILSELAKFDLKYPIDALSIHYQSSIDRGKDIDKDKNTSKTKLDTTTQVADDQTTTQIDALYTAYPKHVGRGQAVRAIRTALKKSPYETIMAGVQRYAAERAGQDVQYTANPATWFNGERWADEKAQPPPKKNPYTRYDPFKQAEKKPATQISDGESHKSDEPKSYDYDDLLMAELKNPKFRREYEELE